MGGAVCPNLPQLYPKEVGKGYAGQEAESQHIQWMKRMAVPAFSDKVRKALEEFSDGHRDQLASMAAQVKNESIVHALSCEQLPRNSCGKGCVCWSECGKTCKEDSRLEHGYEYAMVPDKFVWRRGVVLYETECSSTRWGKYRSLCTTRATR